MTYASNSCDFLTVVGNWINQMFVWDTSTYIIMLRQLANLAPFSPWEHSQLKLLEQAVMSVKTEFYLCDLTASLAMQICQLHHWYADKYFII
jgi:hypothetical protein